MRKSFVFVFLFLASALFGSKLPEIGPRDVTHILQKIMDAHATHKELSTPLIERSLTHYLDELDPLKTYFLENEVEKWLKASPDTLESIRKSLTKSDFSAFFSIHTAFVKTIERKKRLESEIADLPLLENASADHLKDHAFAKDEEELKTRLLEIKTLQMQAASKLSAEAKEKALQRISKRKSFKEEEASLADPRFILTNVLKAMTSSFDAHTAYFTPLEASQFMIQVQQRLFGIGAQLRDDLNGFTIVKIIEGSPASKSALKDDDRVIAIDGEPVFGLEITDAVELIRGPEGTSVLLTVIRPSKEAHGEETLNIEVKRGEVVIKEARLESKTVPFGDGVIAHLSLHAFYQDPTYSSASDLSEEISKIKKEHKIKGIVLDLRNNSGGILPQAVAVTGLFITKGIVVAIKDNTGKVENLREINSKVVWDGPLVVLVSKASASAAEIVAQSLQDYGRAIIIGDEHTYGKGTFQTFSLDSHSNGKVDPKGEFKVTRGRYYTVSGKSPQLVGVKPDIIIPGPYSHLEIGERYASYPLENDLIEENFTDNLADIPVKQREEMNLLYRFNLQPKIKMYSRHICLLQQNADQRMQSDKFYQNFLSKLKAQDKEYNPETFELFAQADVQLKEAINVMKDLILVLN